MMLIDPPPFGSSVEEWQKHLESVRELLKESPDDPILRFAEKEAVEGLETARTFSRR